MSDKITVLKAGLILEIVPSSLSHRFSKVDIEQGHNGKWTGYFWFKAGMKPASMVWGGPHSTGQYDTVAEVIQHLKEDYND